MLLSATASAQEAPAAEPVTPRAQPRAAATTDDSQQASPPKKAAVASRGKSGLTRQGNFLFGASTNFSFTTATNELVTPDQGSNQKTNATLFWVLNPELGYFLSDNFQLSINLGVLLRRLQREGDEGNTERSWLANLGVKYHINLNEDFSIIPGAGIGMYFGSSTRRLITADPMTNMPRIFDEPTSTFGLDIWSQLMFGYLVGTNTELQAGVQFRFLYGTETIDSQNRSLSASTLNTGLALNLTYYF
jgi:hypothetical protein